MAARAGRRGQGIRGPGAARRVSAVIASLLAAALLLHPLSQSSSRITVRGAHLDVALRCQAASLLEVLGAASDADGDGLYSQPELDTARERLATYLLERYRISTGGSDAARATPLAGRLLELRPDVLEPDTFGVQQWIAAALVFEADAPVPDLLIEDRIFQDAAPNHADLCTVQFNDEPPGEAKFWAGETLRYYRPGGQAARIEVAPTDAAPAEAPVVAPAGFEARVPLLEWIGQGLQHILSGTDHIAFVIGLLVAAGSLATLLGVITAFTLAHSITLALAALDVVHAPSALVELLIAASIAWVGIANLLQHGPVARWKEAFVFGLVHGLGFATALRELLAGESRRLLPLLGFNLGVEAGQLLLVGATLAVLWIGRRALLRKAGPAEASRGLVPRPLRVLASIGVAGAGLFWMAERARDLF
jgi:hypothetical protein